MRILGIDCGTQTTGYGLIDSDGRAAGIISTSPRDRLEVRLLRIVEGLRGVILAHAPEAAAVEEVFYAQNVRTALTLSHARGVVLLALAEAGLVVGEYSPLAIKTSVVGYGRAEKQQVKKMVHSLLALRDEIESEDACDAIAVAICHATHVSTRLRMGAAR